MQSVPGLKKCFDFVAGLSKKILGSVPIQSFSSAPEKTQEKSLPNQITSEKLSINPILTEETRKKLTQNKTIQRPKVICFESYMQNKPNTLKTSITKFLTKDKNCYTKINQSKTFKQLNNDAHINSNSNTNIPPTKFIENSPESTDKRKNQKEKQIVANKLGCKPVPINAQIKSLKKNSEDDSDSESEDVHLGKKDKKMIKKNLKNSPIAESIQINTNQIIFTYEDGDDISSIAAKSETTDQIEPQLLSFLSKRGNLCYYKFDEPKISGMPALNMKKKSSHHQGEAIQVKSPRKKQEQLRKKTQSQQKQSPNPKKRAFQLYPGETFEQFKKRVLIQQHSESQSEQSNSFQNKIIKKEEYNKLISHLNNSLSKMEEEKSREASILVVQKMVDESENQQSNSSPARSDQCLEEAENYKVWKNAADNPSFKLYFRDV